MPGVKVKPAEVVVVRLLTFLLARPLKPGLSAISNHKVELVFCQLKVALYGLLAQLGTPVTARLVGVVDWVVKV